MIVLPHITWLSSQITYDFLPWACECDLNFVKLSNNILHAWMHLSHMAQIGILALATG